MSRTTKKEWPELKNPEAEKECADPDDSCCGGYSKKCCVGPDTGEKGV